LRFLCPSKNKAINERDKAHKAQPVQLKINEIHGAIMTATIVGVGRQAFTYTTASGSFAPAVGYKLHTYASGTSTPKLTWSDAAQTATNANPIVLDARGECSVFWNGTYSIELRTPGNALVWRQDGYQGGGGADATGVEFTQAGTGAATRTVDSKLKQYLASNDYTGVDPTGATDSTVGLKAVFDYAIPRRIPVELDGNYLISGTIQPNTVRASGGLHIVVKGNCSITVNAASTGFADVLSFYTTAFNSATIVGGTLAINGNNKAARGISIRHDDASGGDVLISAKLKLTNFLNTDAASFRENAALSVYGQYGTVDIDSPFVDGVNRTNPSISNPGDDSTSGISVAQAANVIIRTPYVANVLAGPAAAEDADGIKVFGLFPSVSTEEYKANIYIDRPVLINNQGRGCKVRGTSVVISNPIARRTAAVVAIPQAVEFDFQACVDAILLEPQYEYYGTDNVAPFLNVSTGASSFSCVAFQQSVTSRESVARSVGGSLITQVRMPRYLAQTSGSGAQKSIAEVDGLNVLPFGALGVSCFSRAGIEFSAANAAAKTERTKLVWRKVTAPMYGVFGIAYADYTAGDMSSKLQWEVTDCTGTIPGTSANTPFGPLGGSTIGTTDLFRLFGNYRYRSFATTGPFQNFSFNKLVPGSRFTVTLSSSFSIPNSPGWTSAGYALVEVLDELDSETALRIRVIEQQGELGSQHWYTTDGGSNWTNTNILPQRSAAAIAAIGNAINTQYKKAGLAVFDNTNGRVMVATGSTASSSWYGNSVGSVSSVFPA
jgi:hypothetical protein